MAQPIARLNVTIPAELQAEIGEIAAGVCITPTDVIRLGLRHVVDTARREGTFLGLSIARPRQEAPTP